MKTKRTRTLCFGFFAAVLLLVFGMGNTALGTTTIYLEDIDSALTSPSGIYRWLDTANQEYGTSFKDNYNYTQATVTITFEETGPTFRGTLTAENLKPNFTYQFKLVGISDDPSNELIGLTGRWWQQLWNGSEWINVGNLNNKGDGSSPNPNDYVYFSTRDDPNYRYSAYRVLDYFITDENGNASLSFEVDSSYHVLWKTSQRARTSDDGPIESSTFDVDPGSSEAYDVDYDEQTVEVFGEWERKPVGGLPLLPGDYWCNIILTEESFHGDCGTDAGCWAAATGTSDPISFTITAAHVGDMDGSSSSTGKKTWMATATLEVHITDHSPVADAAITGVWSGGFSGTDSCTTSLDGTCDVTSDNISTKSKSTRFIVKNVISGSLIYDASANHDPDGDSDGTSITISKPSTGNGGGGKGNKGKGPK